MKTFGLGDLAYYAFRPVVYFIDWVWQTDMKHCEVCAGRRQRWNRWSVPRYLAVIFLVTSLAALICWVT